MEILGKTLARSQAPSPTKCGKGSLRKAMTDRLISSEAISAVSRLLSVFPNGAPHDPKGYIGALAELLQQYPRVVAIACCDPLKGVARTTRFMPTVADVVSWCERETAIL